MQKKEKQRWGKANAKAETGRGEKRFVWFIWVCVIN
jgi:hypothetical protein